MIKVIKLISGEELIGDVTLDNSVTIKNPCYLQMVPSKTNPEQPAMALVPSALHLQDRGYTFKPEHVLFVSEPVKELYNQYNSVFGSGIQLSV